MAHGVNANLLRRWIVLHRAQGHAVAPALLPVTVRASSAVSAPASNSSSQEIIEIEIHGARVRLCGEVNVQRLGAVLDVLAHRA